MAYIQCFDTVLYLFSSIWPADLQVLLTLTVYKNLDPLALHNQLMRLAKVYCTTRDA